MTARSQACPIEVCGGGVFLVGRSQCRSGISFPAVRGAHNPSSRHNFSSGKNPILSEKGNWVCVLICMYYKYMFIFQLYELLVN